MSGLVAAARSGIPEVASRAAPAASVSVESATAAAKRRLMRPPPARAAASRPSRSSSTRSPPAARAGRASRRAPSACAAAPRARRRSRSAELASRCAVGSSSSSKRRAAQQRPRERDPPLLAGRQSPHVRVEPNGEPGSSERGGHLASRQAVGAPSRTASATLPGSSSGRCGTQASRRRQAAGLTVARSTPPTVARPASGSTKRSSSASSVDLPAPLGPTIATRSPGCSSSSTPSSTRPRSG